MEPRMGEAGDTSPGRQWRIGDKGGAGGPAVRVERILVAGSETNLLLARGRAAEGAGWRVLKAPRADASEDARRRFDEEFERTIRCKGDHLSTAEPARTEGGVALSMPLHNGPSLAAVEVELLRRDRGLPAAVCAWVGLTVARALTSLHSGAALGERASHGAVRPENVLTTLDGGCVLIDLGHCGPLTAQSQAQDVAELGRLLLRMLGPDPADPPPLRRRLRTLGARMLEGSTDGTAADALAALGRLLERRAELDPRGLLAAELRELFGALAREGAVFAIPHGPLRPPSVPLVLAWPRSGLSLTDHAAAPTDRSWDEAADTPPAWTAPPPSSPRPVAPPPPEPPGPAPGRAVDPAPTLKPAARPPRPPSTLAVAAVTLLVGLLLWWLWPSSGPQDTPPPLEGKPAAEAPSTEPAATAASTPAPSPPSTAAAPSSRPTPRPTRAAKRAATAPASAPAASTTPRPTRSTPATTSAARPAPTPKPRKADPATVLLTIVTVPSGANVAVDGEARGAAPLALRLAPGSLVQVRASHPGHLATHRMHRVPEAGGSLQIELAPEP